MSADAIFKILNLIALVGWLALVISHWFKTLEKFVIGVVVTILSVAYTYLIVSNFQASDMQGFSSLAGIKQLFSNDNVLLAGWVHYLAFDLLTGCFIVANAKRNNIRFGFILPCLLFTFMLGPFGLLLYFVIRSVSTKKYFTQNF